MNLWTLYLDAYRMLNELEFQLRMLRIADANDPKCLARDELTLWVEAYRNGTATLIDGLLVTQSAAAALWGEVA